MKCEILHAKPVLFRINTNQELVTLFHGKRAGTYQENIMIDASFIISIAPVAIPAAAGLVSAGVIGLAEKLLPSDEE